MIPGEVNTETYRLCRHSLIIAYYLKHLIFLKKPFLVNCRRRVIFILNPDRITCRKNLHFDAGPFCFYFITIVYNHWKLGFGLNLISTFTSKILVLYSKNHVPRVFLQETAENIIFACTSAIYSMYIRYLLNNGQCQKKQPWKIRISFLLSREFFRSLIFQVIQ